MDCSVIIQTLPKSRKKRDVSNLFYEAGIILISKPKKDSVSKENDYDFGILVSVPTMAYILGVQGWLNIRNSINVIH